MTRRGFIALFSIAVLCAAIVPISAQAPRQARIGYLNGAVRTSEGGSPSLEALKEGLHQLGWREDHTFNVEPRFANGDSLNIARLASELVTLRPDLIVATGSSETKALQAATRDIPIVFLQIVDPLSLGVVGTRGRFDPRRTEASRLRS